MAQQHFLQIAEQRAATPQLQWLTLHAPGLTRSARAGQYLLVRCAPPGSYDPLLRRPLFIAAAEESLGQIGLLHAPDERGLAWLSRERAGDTLDVTGPWGHGFTLDRRARTLLLIGQGTGLAALLLLAQQAIAQGCAVTLLAGAADESLLPPPWLLPSEVEYQSVVGAATELLEPQNQEPRTRNQTTPTSAHPLTRPSLLTWADQVCAALPEEQLPLLRDAISAAKYRWERGFASVLREGPLMCGTGTCGVCAVETRRGPRMLCSDGPVFDLRDAGRR